jgi:signal transduction histidine kinase
VPEEIPEEPVSSKARHELFLAAKEALQNIVKHSGADRVQISFGLSERALTLAISDNGRGLPSSTTGLEKDGLHNMQKRMTSVGGHFTARSEPGSGTTACGSRRPHLRPRYFKTASVREFTCSFS